MLGRYSVCWSLLLVLLVRPNVQAGQDALEPPQKQAPAESPNETPMPSKPVPPSPVGAPSPTEPASLPEVLQPNSRSVIAPVAAPIRLEPQIHAVLRPALPGASNWSATC